MSKTEYTHLPVCPYCGQEKEDPHEHFESGPDGEATIECAGCERDYVAEREMTVTFSTYKIDAGGEEMESWDKLHLPETHRPEEASEMPEQQVLDLLDYAPGALREVFHEAPERLRILSSYDQQQVYKALIAEAVCLACAYPEESGAMLFDGEMFEVERFFTQFYTDILTPFSLLYGCVPAPPQRERRHMKMTHGGGRIYWGTMDRPLDGMGLGWAVIANLDQENPGIRQSFDVVRAKLRGQPGKLVVGTKQDRPCGWLRDSFIASFGASQVWVYPGAIER